MLIVTEPFDPVDMPMLLPAMRYEVPSVSFVREPLRPALKLTAPVKVDPLIVATLLSSIVRVTVPLVPPPRRPFPAVTPWIVPLLMVAIVTAPFDPLVMVTLPPAMR